MKEFCKRCEQILPKAGILEKLNGEPSTIEFADGKYCIPCGRSRIEESRKGSK